MTEALLRAAGAAAILACLLLGFSSWAAAATVNDLLKLDAVPSEKAKSSLLLDIARAGQRLVAVGERGHIIYSDDLGGSWNQAKVPVMVTLTAVDFPSPKMGWAVGHDGIVLHSADGGMTWMKQMDGNDANQLLLAQAEGDLRKKTAELESAAASEREDLEIQVEDLQWSVDSARVSLEEGPWRAFLDVRFEDENRGIIIGSYGMMFRTDDGGKRWLPWTHRVPNPGQLHLNAFGPTRSGLVMVGEEGTIYRSLDRGVHWEKVESPYDGSFFGVITNVESDTVIALGLRGSGFLSSDFGGSWKKIDVDTNTSLNGGFLFPDGRACLLSNKVFCSQKDKTVFTERDVPLSIYSSMVPVDDDIILAGMHGVFKFTNDGNQ